MILYIYIGKCMAKAKTKEEENTEKEFTKKTCLNLLLDESKF